MPLPKVISFKKWLMRVILRKENIEMNENENENENDQIKSFYNDSDISIPDDMLVPDLEESKTNYEARKIEDDVKVSFKFCFLGAGQGGSRLAETFDNLGYKRTAAVNTASSDLNSLSLENKLCVGDGGGAGKDPAVATHILQENKEDVIDFMRYSFGESFDRIFICVGAGGGTGSGMVTPLVSLAEEVQELVGAEEKKVGVILTLPKKSEGDKVNKNASVVLNNIFSLVEAGKVSPLILLDNDKVAQLYPNVAVSKFWSAANSSLAGLFHLFNLTSAKDSSYTSFDKNDYKTILNSGLILFGASPVKKWNDPVQIARTVRENLRSNLLSDGVDISTGHTAGVIIIGNKEILDNLPQGHIDKALDQLNRILKKGGVVHGGVYSGDKPTLNIFSVVGGLDKPVDKIRSLYP